MVNTQCVTYILTFDILQSYPLFLLILLISVSVALPPCLLLFWPPLCSWISPECPSPPIPTCIPFLKRGCFRLPYSNTLALQCLLTTSVDITTEAVGVPILHSWCHISGGTQLVFKHLFLNWNQTVQQKSEPNRNVNQEFCSCSNAFIKHLKLYMYFHLKKGK